MYHLTPALTSASFLKQWHLVRITSLPMQKTLKLTAADFREQLIASAPATGTQGECLTKDFLTPSWLPISSQGATLTR